MRRAGRYGCTSEEKNPAKCAGQAVQQAKVALESVVGVVAA